MIISNSLRFVYIHIHKAGGTSMEIGLGPHLKWNDLSLGGTVFGEAVNEAFRNRYQLNKHSSISEVETICGKRILEEYYVFSTVRHPLLRICSLYNFVGGIVLKFTSKNRLFKNIRNVFFDNMIGKDLNKYASLYHSLGWPASRAFILTNNFSSFIRHPELMRESAFDTQVSRLRASDGRIRGDFYKLETQQDWLPHLREKLGFTFDFPHANESKVKLVSPKDVNQEDLRFIWKRFEEDYQEFSYAK
jgi:hypothetical protein